MDSKLILVVIGVIATVIGLSEAIICYECSNDDTDCQDPFNPDGVLTCNNPLASSCRKTWVSYSSRTIIIFFRCINLLIRTTITETYIVLIIQ